MTALFSPRFLLSAGLLLVVAMSVEGASERLVPGAEPTDPQAQYDLGMRYGRGEGLPRDDQRARHWLARAAVSGHAGARYALGWLYYTGRGVPRDFAKAAELFEGAADRGDPESQYMMGVLHAEGKGVPRDSRQSIIWMRKAAAQGHPGAIQVLRGLFGPAVKP